MSERAEVEAPEVEQAEGEAPREPEFSASPPMPEVARVAVQDALQIEPEPPPAPEKKPPAKQAAKKKGRRTRRDLLRENRELAARLQEQKGPGSESPPAEEPAPAAEAPQPEVKLMASPPAIDVGSARLFVFTFLAFCFRAVSFERGDHWQLQEEDRQWTDHLGDAIAPHLPALGAMLPWLMGGMGMVSAIQKRVGLDKELKGEGPHGRHTAGS